jgi:hypothetical protein
MIKKVSVGFAALAAMGIAGAASAQSNTDSVDVNIEVLGLADLWSNDPSINLVLSGANQENSAAVASSLSLINNVAAKIDVAVDGSLPAPIVPGGGINFFLFPDEGDVPTALGAIVANAYNPAGALVWTNGNLNTSQELAASGDIGINTSITPYNIVYAASAPGEAPLPADFDLTVTYTFVQD